MKRDWGDAACRETVFPERTGGASDVVSLDSPRFQGYDRALRAHPSKVVSRWRRNPERLGTCTPGY